MNRRCTKCLTIKNFSEFYKRPKSRHKFGISSACKECVKQIARNYRRDFPEKAKAACKKWGSKNIEKRLSIYRSYYVRNRKARIEYAKKYNKENKHKIDKQIKRNYWKYQARWKLNGEIRSGRIKRLPCENCGNKKSQAHHEDYKKPLDVKWLCSVCHGLAHRIKLTPA